MVLINADVTFQGYEQRTIKNGEKAGQTYYVVKFMSGFDTLEFMIFNDSAELISKILKATTYDKFIANIGLSQNSGNTKLSLIDLQPTLDTSKGGSNKS